MKLQSLSPPASLSGFVNHIVVLEFDNLPPGFIVPLIANGYPGIVFHTTGSSTGQAKKIPTLSLFGLNIQPIELSANGPLMVIAWFLYPAVLKSFFGIDANALTNLQIDLNHTDPAREIQLKEQLLNAVTMEQRLALGNDYISRLAAHHHAAVNNAIFFATSSIRKNRGICSLGDIQKELFVTERTFQRLFESHVGTSPRMYSRICQFHAALQQLGRQQFSKLSDVALDNGYADQSHFIRAFREFTLLSPGEYLKIVSGLPE